MTTPEEVPADIGDIILKFRNYQATEAETEKLCQWVHEMRDKPGFNPRALLMVHYGYDTRAYNRFKKAYDRYREKVEAEAKVKLRRLEAEDFSKFVEDIWKDVINTGKRLVKEHYNDAVEMGYYDEKTGNVDMVKFFDDAANFFKENRDVLETVEERIKDIEAAAKVFAEMAKPNILRIMALRAYISFITEAMRLAALGIPVPESIIIDVKETINRLLYSTQPPLKEEITNV
jgi:hypothetical protein